MNENSERINHLDPDDLGFITELVGLSQSVEHKPDIGACLQELAAMVATLLRAGRCSLMLLKQDPQDDSLKLRVCAHYGDLPDAAYREMVDLKQGISGQVASSGKPLLVESIRHSEYQQLARFDQPASADGFIVCPLIVSDTVIGVVNISCPVDQRRLSTTDLKTASIVALFVSQAIQIYQLQHLMRSHFVKRALGKENEGAALQALGGVAGNSDRLVKLLAKSFFGEMKGAGFSPDQVLSSATEIITLVTREMAAQKQR